MLTWGYFPYMACGVTALAFLVYSNPLPAAGSSSAVFRLYPLLTNTVFAIVSVVTPSIFVFANVPEEPAASVFRSRWFFLSLARLHGVTGD
jgi:hypothetical protein